MQLRGVASVRAVERVRKQRLVPVRLAAGFAADAQPVLVAKVVDVVSQGLIHTRERAQLGEAREVFADVRQHVGREEHCGVPRLSAAE